MSTGLLDRPMSKAKRNDVPAKIDADIIRKARYVALGRDVSVAEYLSGLLGPLVDRDYDDEIGRLTKASDKAPKRSR